MQKDKSPNDLQQEAISALNKKSPLEQALITGIKGAPELGKDEKKLYLGEFRERVLVMLTVSQTAEPAVYPEVVRALKDKRAVRMVVNSGINSNFTEKYKLLAKKMNIPVTTVYNPEFKSETGLVVVSSGAADVPEIRVEDRTVRLGKLGLTKQLINAAGCKVCSECRSRAVESDPDEAVNYPTLSWVDRLLGEKCPGHDG